MPASVPPAPSLPGCVPHTTACTSTCDVAPAGLGVTGSKVVVVTVPVFVAIGPPVSGAWTWIVTVAVWPAVIVPRLHVTAGLPLQEPRVVFELMNVVATGIVSVRVTPVAVAGPL